MATQMLRRATDNRAMTGMTREFSSGATCHRCHRLPDMCQERGEFDIRVYDS